MAKLLLNSQTEADIQSFISNPSHALLLQGPTGSGKYYLASWIGEQLIGLADGKLVTYPYFLHVSPLKSNIGIEEIRQLQSFLQLKTTGSKEGIRRVVIIEDAHNLTLEAQNALLKSLEEPPAGTAIVLTAVETKTLLPTIYSRVQQISVRSIPLDDATNFFTSNVAKESIRKAYSLSGGLAGLLSALLTSESEHPLLQSIEQAKRLFRMSMYERLVQINQLTSDRTEISNLLGACKHIAIAGLRQACERGKHNDIERWYQILTESHRAEERLQLAVSSKLLLTDLFLNM